MSLIPIIAKVAIGKGRIIVTGDMDMFSNPGVTPGIRFGSNRLLALNIFDSLPIPTPRKSKRVRLAADEQARPKSDQGGQHGHAEFGDARIDRVPANGNGSGRSLV